MNAKDYLEQLQLLDTKINQNLERLEEIKHSASGVRAIRYDIDKVQVSPSDHMCDTVTRYLDLDEHINREIDRFADAKEKVIKQIQGLKTAKHMMMLFKVYVQYKTVKEASVEMKISYSYAIEVHKKALEAFENQYAPLQSIT